MPQMPLFHHLRRPGQSRRGTARKQMCTHPAISTDRNGNCQERQHTNRCAVTLPLPHAETGTAKECSPQACPPQAQAKRHGTKTDVQSPLPPSSANAGTAKARPHAVGAKECPPQACPPQAQAKRHSTQTDVQSLCHFNRPERELPRNRPPQACPHAVGAKESHAAGGTGLGGGE